MDGLIIDGALRLDWNEPDRVATVRLHRPSNGNRITPQTCDELRQSWAWIRDTDDVRAVAFVADGADFCLGADADAFGDAYVDIGAFLNPKRNRVWKPVVCGLHGRVAGPALHVVNGADIVVAATATTFFDDELSNGRVSAVMPVGLAERLPIGEVLRLVLMSDDERMSVERAHQLGLVSEIVSNDVASRAQLLAARLACKAPTAIQGTVRAIWESQQMPPWIAQAIGGHYVNLGNDRSMTEVDPTLFESGHRPEWELR